MFGLFASAPVLDPQLGTLERRRGLWRGTIRLAPGITVPLALAGTRSAPEPQALRAAKRVEAALPAWRPAIARALYEHYSPYAESVAAGEEAAPARGLPRIAAPEDVWDHVEALFVAVGPLDGRLTVEIGYAAAWDEEHTLGARFVDDAPAGLCGSVLAP